MRKRHKPVTPISTINLAGLSAVMFALVALFLYPQFHGTRPYAAVDLPRVAHAVPVPNANRFDAINVSVAIDGAVYVNDRKVRLSSVSPDLKARVAEGAERAVYMRVDHRSRYGTTLLVLDAVRDAGIERVVFIAEDRR